MKIAVCFSGQIRTAVENFANIKNFLGDIYNNCDFFMHCWDDCSYKTYNLSNIKKKPYKESTDKFKKLYELYLPKYMQIDSPDNSFGYTISNEYRLEPLWYSFLKSIQYKERYEIENGFEYDYVIKLRYDVIIKLNDDIVTIVDEIQKIKNNIFYINNYYQSPEQTTAKDRLAYDVIFISKSKEMNIASNYFWEMAKNYDNNDNYINLPEYLKRNNIETKRVEFIDKFLLLRDDFLDKINYNIPIDNEIFEKMQKLEDYYYSSRGGNNPLDRLFIDDFLKELQQKGISLNTNAKYYLEDLKNQL
jgi:hypothetical protein